MAVRRKYRRRRQPAPVVFAISRLVSQCTGDAATPPFAERCTTSCTTPRLQMPGVNG